jgi:predicted O-linked N-acetylglucosamine transferase (SPINDLY family)
MQAPSSPVQQIGHVTRHNSITCTIVVHGFQHESHVSGRQSTNHLLGDHTPLVHASLQSTSYGADELSNLELHGQVCEPREKTTKKNKRARAKDSNTRVNM